jgi:hemoglobin/transferrin/lactoferrin receptor protein
MIIGLDATSLALALITILGPRSTVTVTADRVAATNAQSAAKIAFVHDRELESSRPLTTIGDLFQGDPGILVQATTTAQVSPFLRGLTGYQVLNLVDGVRYNNSTFRSGPNQYLALLEPSQARSIEAVLGPAAAEFGSDALGGVIQVLTPEARFTPGLEVHGSADVILAGADLSANGNGQLQVSSRRWSWLAGGSGHRLQDLRAGGGTDSRHTLRRFFGLNDEQIRAITGNRQQDSGFAQGGVHSKFAVRPSDSSVVSVWYERSAQTLVRNYKDLWGGLGRLQSDFAPQTVDLFYARGEKTWTSWFESLSGTFSINRQQDGSARRNLRITDALTEDDSRVTAYGYTGQGRLRIGSRQAAAFGAEFYDERIASTRLVNRTAARPLFPDGSTYRTNAIFFQDSADLFARRLRLSGGFRWTRIRYETFASQFGTAAAVQTFNDWTYNFAASWQATRRLGFQFVTGRGFRAPNANDLGAVGLNDLGYEVPSADAVAAGALLSSSSGENAVSLGRPLVGLSPENLFNYEGGVRWQSGRLYLRAQAFWADLQDPIVRRTLLFPATSVPSSLGGQPVTPIAPTPAQAAQGVITVATPVDPRAVKAFVNDGQSVYYGVETLGEYRGSQWQIRAGYSYIVGRDLNPNRNIRRLPPQQASLRLRRQTSWRGLWMEAGMLVMGAQNRLSGGDLDDERIGASRSRADIAAFFNGTRISPYIQSGAFTPTGETLLAIQNRVLPGVADNVRVPLYRSTAGFAVFDVGAGMPLTDQLTLSAGVQNLFDKNYRFHGSGVDSPGVNAFVAMRYRF